MRRFWVWQDDQEMVTTVSWNWSWILGDLDDSDDLGREPSIQTDQQAARGPPNLKTPVGNRRWDFPNAQAPRCYGTTGFTPRAT